MKKLFLNLLMIIAIAAGTLYYFRETEEVSDLVELVSEQVNHAQHKRFIFIMIYSTANRK